MTITSTSDESAARRLNSESSLVTLRYNMSTPYYQVSGSDRNIRLQSLPDYNAQAFWSAIISMISVTAVILSAFYLFFLIIRIDKLTPFELRLKKERKEEQKIKKKMDKKKEKEAKKFMKEQAKIQKQQMKKKRRKSHHDIDVEVDEEDED